MKILKKKTLSQTYSSLSLVFIVSIIVTLIRLLILHHYINWHFLWGGDQVPVLNKYQLLDSVFTFKQPWRDLGIIFVPQLSIILFSYIFEKIISIFISTNLLSSNLIGWIVNSIWFLIGTMLLWYVVSSFKYVDKIHKFVTFSIMAILFAFNPWATIDTFKSYLNSTSIQSFLEFIIIAFYVKLLKIYEEKMIIKSYELLFIIASTIILCTFSPSSAIRESVIMLIIEAILLFLIYIYKRNLKTQNSFLIKTILVSFIPLIIAFTSIFLILLTGYYGALKQRVISRWGTLYPPQKTLYPPYANTINSFIGMTSWIAHSIYMPYHELYEYGVVAGLMLLWPLLSFGGIFIIIIRERRKQSTSFLFQLLFLLIMGSLSIMWGTALSPPFALFKKFLVSGFPLLVKILPWGISTNMLKFIYITSTSYTIGYLSSLIMQKTNNYYKMKYFKIFIIIIVVSIFLYPLLYTALPIFNGQVFQQYYNKKIQGFNIPQEYKTLYNIRTNYYEHILLLPATPTYVRTTWGFAGSVMWYHTLNNAILTRSLAPYSKYTGWKYIYDNITNMCLKIIDGNTITKYIELNKIKSINAKILAVNMQPDGSINISIVTTKKKATIILPLQSPLNISMYQALEIDFSISSNSSDTVVSPLLSIYSGTTGGAHILPSIKTPGEVTKIYAVGIPDKPWPASKYDPSHITSFLLKLKILKNEKLKININLKIIVGNNMILCKSYKELLSLLNIKYIIIDRSLNTYNKLYKLIEKSLEKTFKLIYNASILAIYKTNITTLPFHVIGPNKTNARILNKKPTDIQALLRIRENDKKIMLIMPMLYIQRPFNIFSVTAKINSSQLNVVPINYKGLQGYIIELSNRSGHFPLNISISIRYSLSFIIIYLVIILFNLMPLILLCISLMLYILRR